LEIIMDNDTDIILDNDNDFDSPAARAAMRKRQAQFGRMMMMIAAVGLRELEQKIASGQVLDMSAEDARKLYESGARLERAAIGEHDGDDAPVPPVSHRKPH
jgi:hypothetical protein